MNGVKALHDPASWAPSGRKRWTPSTSDDAIVSRGLKLHAGWGAIAHMLGRPEPDVRRYYDRAHKHQPIVVMAVSPSPEREALSKPVLRTGRPRRPDTLGALVLGYVFKHPQAITADVVSSIRRPRNSIKVTLCQLRERGLLESPKRGAYLITEAGKAALAGVRT